MPREQGFIDMKAFDAGVGDEGCIAFDFRTAGEGETNYQFTVPPVHA